MKKNVHMKHVQDSNHGPLTLKPSTMTTIPQKLSEKTKKVFDMNTYFHAKNMQSHLVFVFN